MATASVRSKLSRNDNKELTASIPINEIMEIQGSAHLFDDVTYGNAGVLANELVANFTQNFPNWANFPMNYYLFDPNVRGGLDKYKNVSKDRFGGIKYDFIYNRSILGLLAENRLFKHLCQVFDEVKIMGFDLTADVTNLNVLNVSSRVGMIIPKVDFSIVQVNWQTQQAVLNGNNVIHVIPVDGAQVYRTNRFDLLKEHMLQITGAQPFVDFIESVGQRLIHLDDPNGDDNRIVDMTQKAYNLLNYDYLMNCFFDRELLGILYGMTFATLFDNVSTYGGLLLKSRYINWDRYIYGRANRNANVYDGMGHWNRNCSINFGVEPFVNFYFGAKRQHPNYSEMANIVNFAWNNRAAPAEFAVYPGQVIGINNPQYVGNGVYGTGGEYTRNCMDLENLKCLASTKKCSKLPGCGMHLELAMLGSSNSEKMLTFPTALFASLAHFLSHDQNGRFCPLLGIGAETIFDEKYVHGERIDIVPLQNNINDLGATWRRLSSVYTHMVNDNDAANDDVVIYDDARNEISNIVNLDTLTLDMDYGGIVNQDYLFPYTVPLREWYVFGNRNSNDPNNVAEANLINLLFRHSSWRNYQPLGAGQIYNGFSADGLWPGIIFNNDGFYALPRNLQYVQNVLPYFPRYRIKLENRQIIVRKKATTYDVIQDIYDSLSRHARNGSHGVFSRANDFMGILNRYLADQGFQISPVTPLAMSIYNRLQNGIQALIQHRVQPAPDDLSHGFGLYDYRQRQDLYARDCCFLKTENILLDPVSIDPLHTKITLNVHGDVAVRMKRMRNLVVNSTAQEPAFLMGTLLIQQNPPAVQQRQFRLNANVDAANRVAQGRMLAAQGINVQRNQDVHQYMNGNGQNVNNPADNGVNNVQINIPGRQQGGDNNNDIWRNAMRDAVNQFVADMLGENGNGMDEERIDGEEQLDNAHEPLFEDDGNEHIEEIIHDGIDNDRDGVDDNNVRRNEEVIREFNNTKLLYDYRAYRTFILYKIAYYIFEQKDIRRAYKLSLVDYSLRCTESKVFDIDTVIRNLKKTLFNDNDNMFVISDQFFNDDESLKKLWDYCSNQNTDLRNRHINLIRETGNEYYKLMIPWNPIFNKRNGNIIQYGEFMALGSDEDVFEYLGYDANYGVADCWKGIKQLVEHRDDPPGINDDMDLRWSPLVMFVMRQPFLTERLDTVLVFNALTDMTLIEDYENEDDVDAKADLKNQILSGYASLLTAMKKFYVGLFEKWLPTLINTEEVQYDRQKLITVFNDLQAGFTDVTLDVIDENGYFVEQAFRVQRQMSNGLNTGNATNTGTYNIDVSGVRSSFLHNELIKAATRDGVLEAGARYIEQQFCIPLNNLLPNKPFNIGAFTAVLKTIPTNERDLTALINGTKEFITDSAKEAIGVFLTGKDGVGTKVQSILGVNPTNLIGSVSGTLIDMAMTHAIIIYTDFFKNEWTILKEFIGGFSMNEEIGPGDNILRFSKKTANNFIGLFTNNYLFNKIIPWAKDWIRFPV